MKKSILFLVAMLFCIAVQSQTDPNNKITSRAATRQAKFNFAKTAKLGVKLNINDKSTFTGDTLPGNHFVVYFTPNILADIYQASTTSSTFIVPSVGGNIGFADGNYLGNKQWNLKTLFTIGGAIGSNLLPITPQNISSFKYLEYTLFVGIPGLNIGSLLSGLNGLGATYNGGTGKWSFDIVLVWQLNGKAFQVIYAK